jgi:hypothetical protein
MATQPQPLQEPDGDEGVVIPEDFQKKVHALVHKAPKAHLAHIRSRVSDREDELRKQEQSAMGKKGRKVDFSAEDAPATL